MVQPIDVGIWNFWMESSDDDEKAVYECSMCSYAIRSKPKNLPRVCPNCDFAGYVFKYTNEVSE